MDEISKQILDEKIWRTLGVKINIEDTEKGFSFYIDRAYLFFDNNDGVWEAHFYKTYYYKENGDWKNVSRCMSIDEYESVSDSRKTNLHTILDFLNHGGFEKAKREYLSRVDCEVLIMYCKSLSFNEAKTTVIGINYSSEPTFTSHRETLLDGVFPDYKNVCIYRHEGNETVDCLYNDFFSPNNLFEYSKIDDFAGYNIFVPCSKGFTESMINQIIDDYRLLVEENKPEYVLNDNKAIGLLNKIRHKCLFPAITNDEEGECTCLWMVENVSNIPLLLFIAMFKNVFGFRTIGDTIFHLNYQSFFWYFGDELVFCAYVFAGAKQVSRFSGFPANKFNCYGQGFKDYENSYCSLPPHSDVFNEE